MKKKGDAHTNEKERRRKCEKWMDAQRQDCCCVVLVVVELLGLLLLGLLLLFTHSFGHEPKDG